MTTLAEIRAAVGDWLVESMEREFTPAEQRLYDALRLPADGVIVTPESLANGLHEVNAPDEIVDGDHWPDSIWCVEREREWAADILRVIATEGGPA